MAYTHFFQLGYWNTSGLKFINPFINPFYEASIRHSGGLKVRLRRSPDPNKKWPEMFRRIWGGWRSPIFMLCFVNGNLFCTNSYHRIRHEITKVGKSCSSDTDFPRSKIQVCYIRFVYPELLEQKQWVHQFSWWHEFWEGARSDHVNCKPLEDDSSLVKIASSWLSNMSHIVKRWGAYHAHTHDGRHSVVMRWYGISIYIYISVAIEYPIFNRVSYVSDIARFREPSTVFHR